MSSCKMLKEILSPVFVESDEDESGGKRTAFGNDRFHHFDEFEFVNFLTDNVTGDHKNQEDDDSFNFDLLKRYLDIQFNIRESNSESKQLMEEYRQSLVQ